MNPYYGYGYGFCRRRTGDDPCDCCESHHDCDVEHCDQNAPRMAAAQACTVLEGNPDTEQDMVLEDCGVQHMVEVDKVRSLELGGLEGCCRQIQA